MEDDSFDESILLRGQSLAPLAGRHAKSIAQRLRFRNFLTDQPWALTQSTTVHHRPACPIRVVLVRMAAALAHILVIPLALSPAQESALGRVLRLRHLLT